MGRSVVSSYETVVQSASPVTPGNAVLTPLGGGSTKRGRFGDGGGGHVERTPALRGVSAQGRERAAAATAAAAQHPQSHRPSTVGTDGGAEDGTSYIALMDTLRQYPNSTEFVYLSRLDKDSTDYNPYALEMVPFKAVDPKDYYTMSVHGVTHFVDGSNADFTTLDQWEREFQLFSAMMRLNVFSQFRKWKGFSVWRGTVRSTKIRRAQTVLEKTLFQLNPVFQKSITEVRRLCFDLSYLRLSKLRVGQLCTLEEFSTAQGNVREEVISKLEVFGTTTIATVDQACQAALDALEQRLNDFYGKPTSGGGGGLGESAVDGGAGMAGTQGESAQYAYTVAAARRSEQRKLLCFVKMTDYMICDTLHEVLVESVSDILAATGQCPEADFEMPLPPYRLRKPVNVPRASRANMARMSMQGNGSSTSKRAKAAEAAFKEADAAEQAMVATQLLAEEDAMNAFQPRIPVVPQFEVELVLRDGALAFVPSAETFTSEVERAISGFIDILATVDRLPDNEELMEKVRDASADADAGSSLADLIDGDSHQELVHAVKASLAFGFSTAWEYKEHFQQFRQMMVRNTEASTPQMVEDYRAGTCTLMDFRRDIVSYTDQKERIAAFYTTSDVGIVRINAAGLQKILLPSPVEKLAEMSARLPELASAMYQQFIARVHDSTTQLSAKLSSAEDFVAQMSFAEEMRREALAVLETDAVETQNLYDLIGEFKFPVSEMEAAAFQTLNVDFNILKTLLEEVEAARDDNVTLFTSELEQGVNAVSKAASDLRALAGSDMILDHKADPEAVIAFMADLTAQVAAQQEEARRIGKFQNIFKMQVSEFEDLKEVVEDVALKCSLWEGGREWDGYVDTWATSLFDQIDIAEMEEKVQRFSKMTFKLERGLPRNKVVPRFKDKVDDYKNLLPVINALLNKSMKTRHWDKVQELIGAPIDRDNNFTLQKILDMEAPDYAEEIAAISTEATQESALEELLHKVSTKWGDVSFMCVSYKESKDTFILGGIEEVTMALEDSMVTMTTILSSRFVGGIRAEVEKVEKGLNLFSETLDEWLNVQKNWMYLESIFSAPDIQRQLPTEAKQFFAVDKQFRDIMRKTRENDNALKAGTTPGYLASFQKANEALDRIQKNLEDYLETKRMAFPRFYFLSNDELLEILAQTKNVQAVQPHMSKCFDGIKSLDFGPDPKSVDIFAMMSPEGESVGLGKNLKARGNVEQWLGAVEAAMIVALKKQGKDSYLSYPEEQRTEWVLKQPAQIVIMVSQIYWCRGVIDALDSGTPVEQMALWLEHNRGDLKDMTVVVRGELSKLHRKIIAALITIDVHARDIVEELHTENVVSTSDFNWQMQLRYYWQEDEDTCLIRQTNSQFTYAYEYLGAQSRLVVTPMTDRCYMTLTGAMHLKLGGAPAGPAGTGKTESTKDLGKALGVQCVVFNCGDNLDYKFMGKFFAGLAQCGAWACFDEFNRIDIEVLSVVAQQLLTIQNAMKSQVARFNFEGTDMKLVHSFAVFITMNPGYAGRTELPDNLKALFRPMAMMIPDYALVAEVMLFSEGFETSKDLSRKMVKLYKLSSEQLSQQDHYDFGMRALKSVLVMAGSLKRGAPDVDEQVTLIRAMRDSNLPKFLVEDAELFEAIVQDLFPGVEVPDTEGGDLAAAIVASMKEAKLQVVDKFVTKTIQLYETFNVRFGVMAVGPTGGGKTTCYQMLRAALSKLRAGGSANEEYQTVHTFVLNPKCIKMGELYGEYNLQTNEWTDGLGSTLIRNAVADTTLDKKWIVFDGPVDAIWIENMNTVLDDNCTLCLPNGERIKLNPNTMRMLFEVEDLSVASPATVSRCGMVYVPPEELGWLPYVTTWANTQLPDTMTKETKAWLLGLFDTTVNAGIAFVRKNLKEGIPTVDINLITSLTFLFKSLVQPGKGVDFTAAPDVLHAKLAKVYVFSFIWSIGGNIESTFHDKFDDWAREKLGEVDKLGPFPGGGMVYDYYVSLNDPEEPKGRFAPWEALIQPFAYSKEVPYFELLVPNVDTTRFSFLLETCLDVDKSLLLTGGTGVGKSVIITDYLARSSEDRGLIPIVLNFSAQTPAYDTQVLIESKLEKKRKTKFGAPPNKKIVLFIDDVNMPAQETYGAQPPVELLRQFQDFRGFYDRKKLFWKDVEDTTLVSACAPPGGGRQEVTPRFFRHFNMLNVPPPNDACMKTILSSIYSGFLRDFTPEFQDCVKPVVDSSVEVYRRISEELLPTPAKSHYTFNLRDLSKVLQGILLITPANCKDKDVMTRLWVHESMRVFHDRLISIEDKDHYKKMCSEIVKKNFPGGPDFAQLFEDRNIIFGDFLKMGVDMEDRVYEEVDDMSKMIKLMEEYLEEYNFSSTNAMQLVFFMDAAEHATRIARILRQPRGNAMLVGVGGSGKQSLTRFAAFMAGFKCFSIELTRGYGINEFREDLKSLYMQTGIQLRV